MVTFDAHDFTNRIKLKIELNIFFLKDCTTMNRAELFLLLCAKANLCVLDNDFRNYAIFLAKTHV